MAAYTVKSSSPKIMTRQRESAVQLADLWIVAPEIENLTNQRESRRPALFRALLLSRVVPDHRQFFRKSRKKLKNAVWQRRVLSQISDIFRMRQLFVRFQMQNMTRLSKGHIWKYAPLQMHYALPSGLANPPYILCIAAQDGTDCAKYMYKTHFSSFALRATEDRSSFAMACHP
jgi:hypothetical protein